MISYLPNSYKVGDSTIINIEDEMLREPPDDQARDSRLVALDRAVKPQTIHVSSHFPERSVGIINRIGSDCNGFYL